jgi:uncharacterized membrane protein (DUF373 family)
MKYIPVFEKIVIAILVVMMILVLVVSLVQLAYTIFDYVSDEPFHILNDKVMMGLFGSILTVLIGIELLDTVKMYLKEDAVRVEIILLVAIIALAKKIIVMDFEGIDTLALLGQAALLITLAAAYFLIKHTDHKYGVSSFFKKNKKNT